MSVLVQLMIIKPFFIWANANDKLILAVVCKNGNSNEKNLKEISVSDYA